MKMMVQDKQYSVIFRSLTLLAVVLESRESPAVR